MFYCLRLDVRSSVCSLKVFFVVKKVSPIGCRRYFEVWPLFSNLTLIFKFNRYFKNLNLTVISNVTDISNKMSPKGILKRKKWRLSNYLNIFGLIVMSSGRSSPHTNELIDFKTAFAFTDWIDVLKMSHPNKKVRVSREQHNSENLQISFWKKCFHGKH